MRNKKKCIYSEAVQSFLISHNPPPPPIPQWSLQSVQEEDRTPYHEKYLKGVNSKAPLPVTKVVKLYQKLSKLIKIYQCLSRINQNISTLNVNLSKPNAIYRNISRMYWKLTKIIKVYGKCNLFYIYLVLQPIHVHTTLITKTKTPMRIQITPRSLTNQAQDDGGQDEGRRGNQTWCSETVIQYQELGFYPW